MFKTVWKVPLAAILAATALAACGGDSSADRADGAPSATSVEVVNIAYAPESLEIEVGDEVEWTNEDESVRHTVTSGTPGDNGVPGVSEGKSAMADGLFNGDLPDAASTFSFTFTEAGTFPYFCEVHPSMVGEVVVR
jgi:plastocyanin